MAKEGARERERESVCVCVWMEDGIGQTVSQQKKMQRKGEIDTKRHSDKMTDK